MSSRFILTPFFLDQPLPGLEGLLDPDWVVNKPVLPRGTTQERMGALYRPLVELFAAILDSGQLPVSVAGDCCTSIGVLAGLQRAGINPTLFWFDAHGDFNTWETTPSGFLGGMPLAMLVGRGEQTIMEAVGTKPIPEDQVFLCDGRDLDPGEREALLDSQVVHLEQARDIFTYPLPGGPLWVHFDTDVVDAGQSPAMNYPVPGGPGVVDLREVFRSLAASGQVLGVSLSSWNPELDLDGRSREVSMSLLLELIGED